MCQIKSVLIQIRLLQIRLAVGAHLIYAELGNYTSLSSQIEKVFSAPSRLCGKYFFHHFSFKSEILIIVAHAPENIFNELFILGRHLKFGFFDYGQFRICNRHRARKDTTACFGDAVAINMNGSTV